MKILETQSAMLSNYEVLDHLTTFRAKPRTTPQKHQNLETIVKELSDYLNPPSTSRSPIPTYTKPTHYSTSTLRALVKGLQPYNLTKIELLMVLNLRPLDATLLDCVVEECDERFTQEKQEEMLKVVGDVLGGREEEEMNGDAVAGADEEGVEEGEDMGGG